MGQGSGGPPRVLCLAVPRRITAGLKTRIESSNQTTATNAAKLANATASSVAIGRCHALRNKREGTFRPWVGEVLLGIPHVSRVATPRWRIRSVSKAAD